MDPDWMYLMCKPIQIDAELALKHLQALADENPNYQYKSPEGVGACVYWTPSRFGQRIPSCIVGHVFDKLGVLDQIPAELVSAAVSRIPIKSDNPMLVTVLREAQAHQDAGVPWSESVRKAMRYVAPPPTI